MFPRDANIAKRSEYSQYVPVMLSCSDSKLGNTFVTVGAVAPWGLFGEHIFIIQDDKKKFNLIIEP